MLRNSEWRIAGDILTVRNANGTEQPPTRIRTDRAAFDFADGNRLGVYEVKGDSLIVSIGQEAGKRPSGVGRSPDVVCYLFARVKGN